MKERAQEAGDCLTLLDKINRWQQKRSWRRSGKNMHCNEAKTRIRTRTRTIIIMGVQGGCGFFLCMAGRGAGKGEAGGAEGQTGYGQVKEPLISTLSPV